ncbi:selina-4(15),7(11)-diene synthase [Streptomyces ochraceiscleroticus]|uniref:Terpene synthase n=1 Tax=Streptomyces ochraceiscleroticus TaxID=47761 RepID=A0ABW1MDD6_9ACTN|nr:selina-4(15),7(11)-diene synthase [Streptomyces ochraceiscleroticus]
MSIALVVPPTYAPIPPAIHPRHADIDAQTTAWAHAFGIGSAGLRERLVTQQIGTFAARILPSGRREVVQVLGDFVLWLFGVDDGLCEEGALGRTPGALNASLQRLLWVAEHPEADILAGDPLARGLRDLRARVAEYGTAGQTKAWIDALREYFLSVVWEASHRTADSVPELDDYTLMRLYDGATTVVLPMLEMAHGYELRPEERALPGIRAAAQAASFVICWDNDLFSYHKEVKERGRTGGYYLNVIRVLEHHRGLSSHQALAEAVSQRDRVMVLFQRLCRALGEQGSPQLRQYLDDLGHFVRGSMDWGISSVRYTTPDDPAALPARFSSTPTSTGPVDIPSITWWWDVLDRLDGTAAHRLPQPATPPLVGARVGAMNGFSW